MAYIWGKVETMTNFIFPGSKITADGDCSHEIKRGLLLGRKPMRYLDSILKKKKKSQRHLFADKGPSSQTYGFSSSHVWMRELDYKEGWVTSLLPSLSVFVMTIVTDVKRLPTSLWFCICLMIFDVEHFSYTYWPLTCSLWRTVYLGPLPILNLHIFGGLLNYRIPHAFWKLTLFRYVVCKYFPIPWIVWQQKHRQQKHRQQVKMNKWDHNHLSF